MNSRKLQLAMLIGHRIRRQRIKLGLSLNNVAESVGLDVGYLSYIETGQRNASLQVVVHLCRVLVLPVEEVFSTNPETLGWKGPGVGSVEADVQGLSLQLLTDPKESRLAIVSATLPFGQPCHLDGLQGGVLTAVQGVGCSILRSEKSETVSPLTVVACVRPLNRSIPVVR